MQTIITFLSGKKTYLMAILYGIDAMGAKLGWWGADDVRAIGEEVMTFIFLRMGVSKSGPVV